MGRRLRRLGLGAVVVCALWSAHLIDRRAAVRQARAGLVLESELAAERALRLTLERRAQAAEAARRTLADELAEAERSAKAQAADLEAYARETEISPTCTLDGALLRRLRAN